jgi:hypothetical protein
MIGMNFPGMRALQRMPPRMPVNPLDRSTVVSVYPMEIKDIKVTLSPADPERDPREFIIPKGSLNNPSTLSIGSYSWWKEIDPEQPLLEIPVPSVMVADSIVKDYCNGLLACDLGIAQPGIFFVHGELSKEKIKLEYKQALINADKMQKAWFHRMINIADSQWARSQGNPLAISDIYRMAALELNLKDKPWIKDYQAVEMVRCAACGTLKNPQYPVCPVCRNVDMTHPNAKNLVFAKEQSHG